jgi:hypothetical protein
MRISRVTMTVVLSAAALSSALVGSAAGQASTVYKTYLPVAGTWHLEAQFGDTKSGSFVVGKSHKSIAHFSLVPSDTSCGGKITVKGPIKLHDTKGSAPDDPSTWSVAKVFEGGIKVTYRQGGTRHKGTLVLDLSPRNTTSHPVKYADGTLTTKACNLLLGGEHGKI